MEHTKGEVMQREQQKKPPGIGIIIYHLFIRILFTRACRCN